MFFRSIALVRSETITVGLIVVPVVVVNGGVSSRASGARALRRVARRNRRVWQQKPKEKNEEGKNRSERKSERQKTERIVRLRGETGALGGGSRRRRRKDYSLKLLPFLSRETRGRILAAYVR